MWQSHLSYHPRVGHTFTPNFRTRVPHSGGGYLLRTNAHGFRSEREFVAAQPPGTYRILLFGDSQAAGLGVSNRQRFGDLLEAAIPGLEVFNYALPGIGTDQQYLLHSEFAGVKHDLVMIAPYVEDVERVASRYLRFSDQHGEEVFYAKPYFELAGDGLQLHHLPVPKLPLRRAELPAAATLPPHATAPGVPQFLRPVLHSAARYLGGEYALRRLFGSVARRGHDGAASGGWRLITEILRSWVAGSPVPVLLVPIPSRETLAATAAASTYQAPYRALARKLGCSFHDPALEIAAMARPERNASWFPHDSHLSQSGHAAIAHSLKPVIEGMMRLRSSLEETGPAVASLGPRQDQQRHCQTNVAPHMGQ